MEISRKDRDVIFHMREYCKNTSVGIERFGDDFEKFQEDDFFRAGICMYILQIGELVTHLSDDFKKQYSAIPWVQIKAMRNIAAHRYGTINMSSTWETIHSDIPELSAFCDKILNT